MSCSSIAENCELSVLPAVTINFSPKTSLNATVGISKSKVKENKIKILSLSIFLIKFIFI